MRLGIAQDRNTVCSDTGARSVPERSTPAVADVIAALLMPALNIGNTHTDVW
jgi:hypothetical protein